MPFAIMTYDKPDSQTLRAALRPAHLAYLMAHQHMLLAGGALLDQEGERSIGRLLIVDTTQRHAAESLIGGDPFTLGGLFASVHIVPWRKAFFDRSHTS